MNDFWNVFNTVAGALSLIIALLGYVGFVKAIWRRRSLAYLVKRRDLLINLNSSPSARQQYLLEGVLWCICIGSAALIFRYVDAFEPIGFVGAARDWIVGFAVYLLALYRLGRIRDATDRYERVGKSVDEAIAKLDERLKK